jgi:multiple antibiotic resistance protein
MILLTSGAEGNWAALLTAHLVMLTVLTVVFLFFLSANLLERALRETGINVVTRLLGMLLAALAVQFVLTGLKDFGFLG